MLILINDLVQQSDAPNYLKTPALAENGLVNTITIDFGKVVEYDCVGIGNFSGDTLEVNGEDILYSEKGLYELSEKVTSQFITIVATSKTIGRFAVGIKRHLGISPAREPGFYSTYKNRTTLSGQPIAGSGGITGRKFSVDTRYKIIKEIMNDIMLAYPTQIGRGYPFFISFADCPSNQDLYPFNKFYGTTDEDWVFQSSARSYKYSKKFLFMEAF